MASFTSMTYDSASTSYMGGQMSLSDLSSSHNKRSGRGDDDDDRDNNGGS
ncbi:hypothetical protein GLAREA_11978 [Glarea lozoyensis ATCC 20868]|uniref:Uncharacterized protein n=1 Tax=Glarea lozoyensis (strain ATCC 20868 / MF5171) TaxID=1116229 RepID=S3DIP0_GLAL2|nr:uncharacterized protein GLAREA_11978 [Glarea lozoyensis ATCC 20868]EPE31896.1 hypothetical protein GLAREA_11978 [Glarea lozoyensis ATCC 20868]